MKAFLSPWFSLRVTSETVTTIIPIKLSSGQWILCKSHIAIFLGLRADRKSVFQYEVFCASYNRKCTVEHFPPQDLGLSESSYLCCCNSLSPVMDSWPIYSFKQSFHFILLIVNNNFSEEWLFYLKKITIDYLWVERFKNNFIHNHVCWSIFLF